MPILTLYKRILNGTTKWSPVTFYVTDAQKARFNARRASGALTCTSTCFWCRLLGDPYSHLLFMVEKLLDEDDEDDEGIIEDDGTQDGPTVIYRYKQ